MRPSVAVASTSRLAADAGAELARQGGNGVDCAIGAALVSMSTEPGVCGLGSGGFVTLWRGGSDPITLDGYAAVPGLGLPAEALGRGGVDVLIPYGGGVRSIVGPGSVAVPGGLAALGQASARFGALPWRELLLPVIEITAGGFPLPQACHQYLIHSADCVFGQDRSGWECLHDDGSLKPVGAPVRVPHLADSLRRLAEAGADDFYRGELGERIADHVRGGGGTLTRQDMLEYRPLTRKAMRTPIGRWEVATNPPPAIGGVVLSAMLKLMTGEHPSLPASPVARQVQVQNLVLGFRHRRLNHSTELEEDLAHLMRAVNEDFLGLLEAPSTVHTSAVDSGGLACAITLSTGYGSGVMPTGTGIWLNNCLGELELNPLGLARPAPGERLPSNMAPTVARDENGSALAIGSPGADRITTALAQVLYQHMFEGRSLEEAVASPRMHLEYSDGRAVLAHEPGIEIPAGAPTPRPFPGRSMYFGGVGAARFDPALGAQAIADPRRTGGTRVVTA